MTDAIPSRCQCPVCGRFVSATLGQRVRKHREGATHRGAVCPGSGTHPDRLWGDARKRPPLELGGGA